MERIEIPSDLDNVRTSSHLPQLNRIDHLSVRESICNDDQPRARVAPIAPLEISERIQNRLLRVLAERHQVDSDLSSKMNTAKMGLIIDSGI